MGKYYNTTSKICETCVGSNKYIDQGKINCIECETNAYSIPSDYRCVTCNRLSTSGTGCDIVCESGLYYNTIRNTCEICVGSNKYIDGNICVECEANAYSIPSQHRCATCTRLNTGKTGCDNICPVGQYYNLTSNVCETSVSYTHLTLPTNREV